MKPRRRLDPWRTWAPYSQDWPPPGCEEPGKFILLEGAPALDLFAHIAQAPPAVLRLGHTFIVPTKNPANLSAAMGGTAPCGCVPAPTVERQADLEGDALRDLVKIDAPHRALVITPREKISIGLLGILPKAWGIGYTPLWARIDLVIVRGPHGPGAWPLDPAWVRALRSEVDDILAQEVAFAFLGWGSKAPQIFYRGDRVSHLADIFDTERTYCGKRTQTLMAEPGRTMDDQCCRTCLARYERAPENRLLGGREYVAVPWSGTP